MTLVEDPTKPDRDELVAFIGHHIRAYREQVGWSQSDLAVMVDKSVATVAGWEAGKRMPSVVDVVAVAWALGVSPGALLPKGGA